MGCSGSAAAAATAPSVVSVEGVIIDPSDAPRFHGDFQQHRPKHFTTLLEAFRYCDPKGLGVVSDGKRLSRITRELVKQPADAHLDCTEALEVSEKARLNFPDFVDWARSNRVNLPVGLPSSCPSGGSFPFPPSWTGPKNDPSWNRRVIVEDSTLFGELQQLLNSSYQKIWTRDRKTTGINRVPDEYRLESALRSENYKDWCAYYARRLHLERTCRSRPGFIPFEAGTKSKDLHQRHQLRQDCNEWLLFHGTSQTAAKAICATDFTMDLAGSATGTLYGKGTYFADSITKADEYAKEDEDGLCCVLLCRVAGGRVLFNSEESPDGAQLQQCVLSGAADSVLGSRDVAKNTFREFVTFDVDQVYVEYVLFYRRIFNRRRPSAASDTPATSASARSVEFEGFGVVGLDLADVSRDVSPTDLPGVPPADTLAEPCDTKPGLISGRLPLDEPPAPPPPSSHDSWHSSGKATLIGSPAGPSGTEEVGCKRQCISEGSVLSRKSVLERSTSVPHSTSARDARGFGSTYSF